ncbi:MAG: alpha/beta fold hydrolase [Sciscionella sp.]
MIESDRQVALHGHRVSFAEYRPAAVVPAPADDDPVVLLHGIAGSKHTWSAVLEELAARRFPRRVIAADLIGHGDSEAPSGDQSLGALANGLRDLLILLGHHHVSVVGHSLGGGVALQFAYQFPEMCGRLALVDSGGLGRAVNPVLRATALPGAAVVLPLLANPLTAAVGAGLGKLAGLLGRPFSAEQREYLHHFNSLADTARRRAFLRTARSVVSVRGQSVSATDRLYLAEGVPTLVVWGDRDRLIPIGHGRRAASLIADSRFEVFAGAGHFPHCAAPGRFTDVLVSFIEATRPARLEPADLAARLAS